MEAKISKVQERTGKTSGKKYFVVNLEGDNKDYLTFDWVAKDIVGKTLDVTTNQKGDTWYIRIPKGEAGTKPAEDKPSSNQYEDQKKYGTTLSYAKDVCLGIITAYMATHPDYLVDSALDFIETALPKVHAIFLEQLVQVEMAGKH